MDSTQLFIVFLGGLIAGTMNSVAGGGTLVSYPALLLAGLNPLAANATNTMALLPGIFSSATAYRHHSTPMRGWILFFSPVSLAGGLVGAWLLVRTPPEIFARLAPFLILFATLILMLQSFHQIRGRKGEGQSLREKSHSGVWLVGAALYQFAVSVYGGYFGAGIGILMLASLGVLGFGHIHQMNILKSVLAFLINLVAAAYFLFSGLIVWLPCVVMAVGAVLGGYAGAHFCQKLPQQTVRWIIIGIGLSVALILFVGQFEP
ncbi:MAG: sulfite exporter TauE/SafE family protein [Verrucomicrobiae bacterium]|nr:sulfite exporter TauE/SafE family protein [Verrucomicrobiae bacterium]